MKSRSSSVLALAIAQALVLAAFILPAPLEHVAHACGNAVFLSLDKRSIQVAEAQAALDEGDVIRARELTEDIRYRDYRDDPAGLAATHLATRAERIWALSYVRDPSASSIDLANVAQALTPKVPSPDASAPRLPDPTLEADRGEAYARIPERKDEAFALLEPLAKKDLIGSPHALGALVRLANERGDLATANAAKARCEGMMGSGPVCRGDFGRARLLRGDTQSYLPPAILALAALAFRLLRSKRDRHSSQLAPWVGHAAKLQGLAIFGAGLYVFAHPSHPGWTTTVLALVLALCSVAERRGFFAAVRRRKIPGLVLRPVGPDDHHLPAVTLFRGPANTETLEQDLGGSAAEPGYREAARRPILTLGRRKPPLGLSFLGATLIAFVVLMGLLAVFAMFFTMRSG